jgi:hypothetical protein
MDFDFDISEDCRTLTVKLGDSEKKLSTEDVEWTIRELGVKRYVMEPTPDWNNPPMPIQGPDAWLMNAIPLGDAGNQRVGLRLCTKQYGWLLMSMPVEAVPTFVAAVTSAALAARPAPVQSVLPGTSKQ